MPTRPRKGSASARVLEEIEADPNRSALEIAAIVGCSHTLVYHIAKEWGVTVRKYTKSVSLLDDNIAWVNHAARSSGVDVHELVNSIITDARLDEQDRAKGEAA